MNRLLTHVPVAAQPFDQLTARFAGAVLAALLFLCGAQAPAQTYAWKNVAINGGGFVTGIITHPSARGLIYARTDIGGAYRWNATNN